MKWCVFNAQIGPTVIALYPGYKFLQMCAVLPLIYYPSFAINLMREREKLRLFLASLGIHLIFEIERGDWTRFDNEWLGRIAWPGRDWHRKNFPEIYNFISCCCDWRGEMIRVQNLCWESLLIYVGFWGCLRFCVIAPCCISCIKDNESSRSKFQAYGFFKL